MVKCQIYSYFIYTSLENMVMRFYEKYEVIDVKFSIAIDVTFNRVNYSAMIIYKEKE